MELAHKEGARRKSTAKNSTATAVTLSQKRCFDATRAIKFHQIFVKARPKYSQGSKRHCPKCKNKTKFQICPMIAKQTASVNGKVVSQNIKRFFQYYPKIVKLVPLALSFQ